MSGWDGNRDEVIKVEIKTPIITIIIKIKKSIQTYGSKKFVYVQWIRVYNQLVNFLLPNFSDKMSTSRGVESC